MGVPAVALTELAGYEAKRFSPDPFGETCHAPRSFVILDQAFDPFYWIVFGASKVSPEYAGVSFISCVS